MSREHTRLLIQRPDGKYLVVGFDYADQWTDDPYRATPMTHYLYEDDTNPYRKEGCIVVEFEVTLTPTGRTCADLFKEEREERARRLAQEAEEAAERAAKQVAQDRAAYETLLSTLGVEKL